LNLTKTKCQTPKKTQYGASYPAATSSRSVDHLKDEVKKKKANALANIDADELPLHRAEIDLRFNKEERMDVLGGLSQSLNRCIALEEERLSKYFGDGHPEGWKYYFIVVIPEGESIYCGGVPVVTLSLWPDDVGAAREHTVH